MWRVGSINSSLTRNQTWGSCIGSMESQPLGSPPEYLFIINVFELGLNKVTPYRYSLLSNLEEIPLRFFLSLLILSESRSIIM